MPKFDFEKINQVFESPENFLGDFEVEDKAYIISRKYIPGNGVHLRLYTTSFTPSNPIA